MTAPSSPGIEMIDVRAGFGAIEVLHGVSLSFPAGAIVALLGRNGSGKSTVLGALAGIVPVRSGAIRWRDRDITRLTTYERAAAGLTLVPEQHNVFGAMTVEENLQVFAAGASLDAAYQTFPELERLGQHRAATLSGGERQMLAVCRAVLRPSGVILLDEVSSGLSPGVTSRLSDVIASLRGPDRVVVVVEQYLQDVMRLADFAYVLRRGEVSFAGETFELSGVLSAVSDGSAAG